MRLLVEYTKSLLVMGGGMFLLVMLGFLLGGCSVVQVGEDRAAALLSRGTEAFCGSSALVKEGIRAKADAATSPHRVRVECAGGSGN